MTTATRLDDALNLVRTARRLTSAPAESEVRQVVRSFDALSCGREARERASHCLHRWARELLDGNSTTAGIYLDRAGLALGVRPSEVRGAIPRPAAPALAPALAPAPSPAPEPAPTSEPAPAAAPAAERVTVGGLSREEQELFASLPPSSAPLQGASALAECWGGRMSPTSARGRYSRLATKLRRHHGRDMLLRGRGRYGRA